MEDNKMNQIKQFRLFLGIFVLALAFLISFSTIDAVAQTCGDQILETGEECEDINTDNGDGCSSECLIEEGFFCDNSTVEPSPGPTGSNCGRGCEITVIKNATPPYDTEFPFLRLTVSIFQDPLFNEFTLTDPSSPQTTFSVPFLSATFLSELVPVGWDLDDITCGPNNVIELQQIPVPDPFTDEFAGLENLIVAVCIFGGEATCTYENSADTNERFDLTVTENARLVPPNFETTTSSNATVENTEFPFTVTAGALDENFALVNQESETMGDMPISTVYTITQLTPEDWMLEDVVCEGSAEFESTLTDNVVVVEVFSPGDLECTFFNTRELIRNVPTLNQWGLIITVVLIGMAGVLVYRRRYSTVK